MKLSIFSILITSFVVVSCGNNQPREAKKSKETEKVKQICTFTYNHTTTKVMWEAYKLSDKVAVTGKMDSVQVTGTSEKNSPEEILNGARFSIHTASVNSSDVDRDTKLRKIFFQNMVTPNTISGKIDSIAKSRAFVSLTMNDVTKTLEMEIEKREDGELKLTGVVDLPKWNTQKAHAALGKACEERHTGPDGVAKLWPDVKISVFTTPTKDCE